MNGRLLTDRVALVTGGSRGVGRGIATALAAAGSPVVISYRRDVEAAQAVVAAVTAAGGRAQALSADLAQAGAAADLVERAAAIFGPAQIVVGNAGAASRGLTAAATEDREYLRMMQVHAWSNLELARSVLPAMRTAGSGSIVFTSSTVTHQLPPFTAPYAAAKAALEAISGVLAVEERGSGVRVNVVAPGLVATDMGDRLVRASAGGESAADLDSAAPFGRVCRPEDVAGAVVFLVSDLSGYVTGQRLVVDGGGVGQVLIPAH